MKETVKNTHVLLKKFKINGKQESQIEIKTKNKMNENKLKK